MEERYKSGQDSPRKMCETMVIVKKIINKWIDDMMDKIVNILTAIKADQVDKDLKNG